MPKQKTHSGAKKRFKITGSGKVMKAQAGMRHNQEKKPSRLTRHEGQRQHRSGMPLQADHAPALQIEEENRSLVPTHRVAHGDERRHQAILAKPGDAPGYPLASDR